MDENKTREEQQLKKMMDKVGEEAFISCLAFQPCSTEVLFTQEAQGIHPAALTLTCRSFGRLTSVCGFVAEPRVNDEKFDSVLQGYYAAIRGEVPEKTQPKKRTKKAASAALVHDSSGKTSTNGAAFLAVCRGKVLYCFDVSSHLEL